MGGATRPVVTRPRLSPGYGMIGMEAVPTTLPNLACHVPAAVAKRSIYVDCQAEVDQFKWIESEKAGRDLGETAIRRWVKDHWWGFLRARWLEHLQGKCFWIELDRGDFGLLQQSFQDQKELLDTILDRLKDGQENLDIIIWAFRTCIPLDPVVRILEALDINSRRLVHRFECVSA